MPVLCNNAVILGVKLPFEVFMSIILEVPTEIEQNLTRFWGRTEDELPQRILEMVAAEGYRQGALSRADVGQLLQLGFSQTEEFLKAQKCYLDYDEADLEADHRTNERLLEPVNGKKN